MTKRKVILFTFIAVLLTGLLSAYAAAERGAAQYSDNVLRLHVIANSNTAEDQALKLKVRDVVGSTVSRLTEGAETAAETELLVQQHIAEIKNAAEEKIKEEGYFYPVEIVTGEFYFPTKYYAKGALPAGDYEAVRVIIGEGKGENWWCVLFPPLCFSNGSAEPTLDQQHSEPSENITVRFKIVEFFQEAKHEISKVIEKIFN